MLSLLKQRFIFRHDLIPAVVLSHPVFGQLSEPADLAFRHPVRSVDQRRQIPFEAITALAEILIDEVDRDEIRKQWNC